MKPPTIILIVFGALLFAWAIALAVWASTGDAPWEDTSSTERVAVIPTSAPEPSPSPEEDSLTAYEYEFLAILRDNSEANERVAPVLLSAYSCGTGVACAVAGDALMEELRRYRPVLVDTIDGVRALGEPPNLAYEELTRKWLAMSELRLEAVDDLVEGWETYNDPLLTEGGNKWTEAGEIYFEILGQLMAD